MQDVKNNASRLTKNQACWFLNRLHVIKSEKRESGAVQLQNKKVPYGF